MHLIFLSSCWLRREVVYIGIESSIVKEPQFMAQINRKSRHVRLNSNRGFDISKDATNI
jgi:hypothetical protein